eukprot:7770812-Pyramimonas_sp.AAC.1
MVSRMFAGLLVLCLEQCVSAAVPKWVIDVSVGWEGGSYFDMLQFCIVRASSLLRSGPSGNHSQPEGGAWAPRAQCAFAERPLLRALRH